MFEKYGVRAQYHPHADSHVDTEENVYRFLDGTDGEFVNLCLDTGHISYCGGDNIAIIERAPERIGPAGAQMERRDQAGTKIRGTGKEGGQETETEKGEEGYRDNATASGGSEGGCRAGLWATDYASGDDHGAGE